MGYETEFLRKLFIHISVVGGRPTIHMVNNIESYDTSSIHLITREKTGRTCSERDDWCPRWLIFRGHGYEPPTVLSYLKLWIKVVFRQTRFQTAPTR